LQNNCGQWELALEERAVFNETESIAATHMQHIVKVTLDFMEVGVCSEPMSENRKGEVEFGIFEDFASRSGLPIDLESIKKEFPPCPDISCQITGVGKVWFELTEACAPEFKQAVSELTKAIQIAKALNEPMPTPPAVWGRDVSEHTIEKKIGKTYPVAEPVELLLYTNGMTSLPDEVLKTQITSMLIDGAGQFRTVWLMGDGVHQIWPPIC